MPQILAALDIDPSSVLEIGPYFTQSMKKTPGTGVQIDICILRKGRVATLIECKFTENPVGVDVIRDMEQKISRLKISRNYSIEKVLISASGVTVDVEDKNYFNRILGLKALLG